MLIPAFYILPKCHLIRKRNNKPDHYRIDQQADKASVAPAPQTARHFFPSIHGGAVDTCHTATQAEPLSHDRTAASTNAIVRTPSPTVGKSQSSLEIGRPSL